MFKVKDKYNIAIVGATGIVGESLLEILSSRKFPTNNIIAIASKDQRAVKLSMEIICLMLLL